MGGTEAELVLEVEFEVLFEVFVVFEAEFEVVFCGNQRKAVPATNNTRTTAQASSSRPMPRL